MGGILPHTRTHTQAHANTHKHTHTHTHTRTRKHTQTHTNTHTHTQTHANTHKHAHTHLVLARDLGAHIDGYIAVCAHTLVVGATATDPATGRKADAVLAAYYAAEKAAEMVRPGAKSEDVTKAIGAIAKAYGCTPIAGLPASRFLTQAETHENEKKPKRKMGCDSHMHMPTMR